MAWVKPSDCDEIDFVASEFAGPGWNPFTGWTETERDAYIMHSTWIAKHPDHVVEFNEISANLAVELATFPGLVGVSLGNSANCETARTLGVWHTEADMRAFVASDVHRDAMLRFAEISRGGAKTHWDATAKDVPGWDSLNHVNLIMQIEEEFDVKFRNHEVAKLSNVGQLRELLASKLDR